MRMKEWLASVGGLLHETELQALERHAEKQRGTEYYTRLMSVKEQEDLLNGIADIPVYRDIMPLWEDEGSDYIAIFRKGPLAGKVCVMSHEETDLTPRWRNVISLLERMEDEPEGEWRDWTCDYPSPADSSLEQLAQDRETVEQLWRLWQQEDDEDIRCQTAYAVTALTPRADLERLLLLLKDDNMYIQEKACERLGNDRYTAAEEQLREVTKNGVSNAKSAAVRALARMNLRP